MERGAIRIIIGGNIRRLREDRGLSTDELAAFLDVPRRTMARFEQGSDAPSCDQLLRFSAFFRCSPDSICGEATRRTGGMGRLAVVPGKGRLRADDE